MYNDALVSLALVMIIGVVWYGPWQWAITDLARQRLFENRDKLFDLALDGRLSFKSDEYKAIRRSFEQSIRFAHCLTFPRFAFAWLMTRHSERPTTSRMQEAALRIRDDATREQVLKLIKDSDQLLVATMILKSPLCLVLLAVTAALAVVLLSLAKLFGVDDTNPRGFVADTADRVGSYVLLEAECGVA